MYLTTEEIREKILEIAEEEEIPAVTCLEDDTSLLEIGISSIQFISLIVLLEEFYGIQFEDDDLLFANIDTIKKIQAVLEKYEPRNEESDL